MAEEKRFSKTSYIIEVPSEKKRSEYQLSIQDLAPCHLACPVGINVKGYVTAIAEEEFEKSLEIIRENNCLPAICGRICTHPCERECTRKDFGGTINIRALKRFASDYEKKQGRQPKVTANIWRKKNVAVIGAGPAGLTAANDLARLGYGVTIFEKEHEPGGLMTGGIPEFRLPVKAVLYDIERIKKLGVTIKTGSKIADARVFNNIRRKYSAVLIATGSHREPAKYRIAEKKADGIIGYIEFMKLFASGDVKDAAGKSVAVVGLGQSALDTARAAIRTGYGKVTLIYPRTKDELQAFPSEVDTAVAEGVEILLQTRASGVVQSDGKVSGIRCVKLESFGPDESGRRYLTVQEGAEFTLSVDAVIAVEPHYPDLSFLPKKSAFEMSRWGYLRVNASDFSTGEKGVFAAGDLVTGPKSVIEAMAAGRRAAAYIHCFLQDGSAGTGNGHMSYPMILEPDEPEKIEAIPPVTVPWSGESVSSEETERAYSEVKAVDEARRCLRCGPCMECVKCSSDCLKEVVMLRVGPDGETAFRARFQKRTTDKLILSEHKALNFKRVITVPPEISSVSSSYLEASPTFCTVDPELCHGCGACEEICEYRAPRVEYREGRFVATIYRDICRECGTCAAHCPSGAISQQYFSDEKIEDEIDKWLKG